MARLIPSVVGSETSSPGERELFNRIAKEPGTDGWIVLHSLDLPNHRRQVAGEIDFVFIVPRLGVLCLEVKAHQRVRRDTDGLWRLGQDPPTRVGPFRQASEGMYSLRDYLTTGRSNTLSDILFWSAVCFTHVPFSLQSPSEWHSWQVIDKAGLSSRMLHELVSAVLVNARSHVAAKPTGTWFDADSQKPTPEDAETIVRIVRPAFEFLESPKSRRRQRDDELRRFTSEQFDALDNMDPEINPRVVFEGPAGTGKTVLAIEEARRASLRSERVLLCCFNNLLGQWISSETQPLAPDVQTSTLHRYMLDLSGLTPPTSDSPGFWRSELPNAALEVLLERSESEKYDVLVVDEAQDLLHDNYLDVLDASVRGGLQEGSWRFFGDFEKQAIFGTDSEAIEDVLELRAPRTSRFRLTKNCRNTPRIAAYTTVLADWRTGYSQVLRPDSGIEPETFYYDGPEDQTRELLDLLDHLFDEGFPGREIVLLSPRARGSAASTITEQPWADRLRPASDRSPGGVRYSSIGAFKGLEAPVVIVTDIESVGSPEDESLLYVAVTRATERLYVLAASRLKPALIQLLLNRLGESK